MKQALQRPTGPPARNGGSSRGPPRPEGGHQSLDNDMNVHSLLL
jgi:hypothetical protein